MSPRTLASVRSEIRRPTKTVELLLDGELVERVERLEHEHAEALRTDEESNAPDRAPAIAVEIDALREQAEESRQTFTFQALPHRAYRRLLTEHPPTVEQIAQAKDNGLEASAFDPDTFAPVLVAATCTDPTGTPEEWAEMWGELSDGQVATLFTTSLATQFQVPDLAPKSVTG
ncbi:hypothetical protein [Streptomyces celluloflavus]|uniref:hypothetical protein n=1 Tax=Streptomyces celluloflavus TaxID=58344 RepID=UPI0036C72ED3